jgi:hypothetical protein
MQRVRLRVCLQGRAYAKATAGEVLFRSRHPERDAKGVVQAGAPACRRVSPRAGRQVSEGSVDAQAGEYPSTECEAKGDYGLASVCPTGPATMKVSWGILFV